nr:unnamed protein product [Callosobruchus chinensis]
MLQLEDQVLTGLYRTGKMKHKKFIKLPGAWHFKCSKAILQGEISYCSNTGTPEGVCKKIVRFHGFRQLKCREATNKGDKTTIASLLSAYYGED